MSFLSAVSRSRFCTTSLLRSKLAPSVWPQHQKVSALHTQTDLEHFNQHLSEKSPIEAIEWAIETNDGSVALTTSMGIQSAVLIHMTTRVKNDIPIVWVDTGFLPPETYRYAEELKTKYGLNLVVATNSLWSAARIEAVHGKLWESEDPAAHALYGKLTKEEPLAKAFAEFETPPAAMFSGLRASQTKARANMPRVGTQNGMMKVLPMLHMSDQDVEDYFDMNNIPRHPLQSQGYVTVGDWHSSRPLQAGEDARATRFGGKFEECGLHVDNHEPVGESAEPVTPDLMSPLQERAALELAPIEPHPDTGLSVVMVKKKLEDGQFCRKCNEVAKLMNADTMERYIARYFVADVQDSDSAGIVLSQAYKVESAPFFLLREQEGGEWQPFRSYLQLRKKLISALKKREEIEKQSLTELIVESQNRLTHLRTQLNLVATEIRNTEDHIVQLTQSAAASTSRAKASY